MTATDPKMVSPAQFRFVLAMLLGGVIWALPVSMSQFAAQKEKEAAERTHEIETRLDAAESRLGGAESINKAMTSNRYPALLTDHQGEITYANPKALDLLVGHCDSTVYSDVFGRNLSDFVVEGEAAVLNDSFAPNKRYKINRRILCEGEPVMRGVSLKHFGEGKSKVYRLYFVNPYTSPTE